MAVPSSTSRSIALDLIAAVLKSHRSLDEALEGHGELAKLEPRDRAFTRNLAATTLRRLGQIDDLINHCLEKPLPRSAIAVRDVLRLGICQLLFLNTPPHAAVDTSVRMLGDLDLNGFKKLVNAILRRLGREGEKLISAQDAERLNTPDWLWHSWSKAYGKEVGRDIAAAHLKEPPLDITVKEDADRWAKSLDAVVLPTGSLRLAKSANVTKLAGFDDGQWWVQDAAAALPALLLGDVAGKTVLDLCAAPGGKTAQLAIRGAKVVSVERSANRLKRLDQNMMRLELNVETVNANAEKWSPSEPADAVLLDAPCSATGTIRRHPDIPHLKKPEDVTNLSEAQFRLFEAAIDMVKPGGVLVFCTCSLQREEGPDVVERILAKHDSLKIDPVRAEEVGGLSELITPSGALRCLPSHLPENGGLDGFFAQRLIRQ